PRGRAPSLSHRRDRDLGRRGPQRAADAGVKSMTAANLVPRDPEPEWGPCMRVLPTKWRRAVEALFLTNGDQSKALRLAGYSGTNESINVMASRIFGDDRVRAAIREVCLTRIDISEPELFSTTLQILRDPSEKAADRLRAIGMIWDRSNPIQNKLKL